MATDPNSTKEFLVYNPDTILRVALVSPEQQLEFLLMKNRFPEAMALLDRIGKRLSPNYAYLTLKTRNAVMFKCLKERNILELRQLLQKYMGQDKD